MRVGTVGDGDCVGVASALDASCDGMSVIASAGHLVIGGASCGLHADPSSLQLRETSIRFLCSTADQVVLGAGIDGTNRGFIGSAERHIGSVLIKQEVTVTSIVNEGVVLVGTLRTGSSAVSVIGTLSADANSMDVSR